MQIHRQQQVTSAYGPVPEIPLSTAGDRREPPPAIPQDVPGMASRVLLIAYYFPPEGGAGTFRSLKFARNLRECGVEPVVLTVRSDRHSAFSVIDLSLLNYLPEGLEIIRTNRLSGLEELVELREKRYTQGAASSIPIPGRIDQQPWMGGFKRSLKNALTNLLTTPDHAAGWIPHAVAAGLDAIVRHKLTALYSTGGPWTDHLVGGILQALTGLPWVADFRDPWTGNLGFKSIAQYPIRSAIERQLEQWVLSRADRIITVSEPIRQELLALRPRDPSTVTVITNAFEPAEFRDIVATPRTDRFTLSHVGRLYANRSPRNFCRAVRMVVDRRPELASHLQVMMVGVIDPEHERAIEEEGVGAFIKRTGHVSRRDALRHMVSADALLLLVHEAGESSKGMYTGKLFEYLGAGRSILALAPEGVARDLVEHHQAGVAADPSDVPAIAQALEQLYDRWLEGGRAALSIPPAQLEPYDALTTTRQLARLLIDVQRER